MSTLAGERVVVTRAEHQAEELASALAAAGANVVHLPLLEIGPPDDPKALQRAIHRVTSYSWVVFTSANAVRAFVPRVDQAPLPPIAVVGPATARSVRKLGIVPELEANRADAEGLVEALLPLLDVRTSRVLVPQADDARPTLAEGLRAALVEVDEVVAYSKRLPPDAALRADALFGSAPLGWVSFTSPRIARHFASLFGDTWPDRRIELRALSIGPVTSRELRALGVDQISEAMRPTPGAMVQAAG